MKKSRKIVVVTGSRAEYGILKPLLKRLRQGKDFDLQLLACGMHVLTKYGSTANDIKNDGFKLAGRIDMYGNRKSDALYWGQGLGRGVMRLTKTFSILNPDMVLVFGDRLEPLAATLAAVLLNIPVGHIHGGDKTDSGHIDESTRHAITRYSHIHFAPTPAAARRLLRMGEQSFRVHIVGTLSIDSILETPQLTKQVVCKILGLDRNKEIMVCLFNPLPLEAEKMGAQTKEICATIRFLKKQTVIIYPNNDNGSQDIIREIDSVSGLKYVIVVKNLPFEQYINLLRHADVLIGNSSSGIVEAPALKLPVVNIGSRNVGREHAVNVIFTEPDRISMQRAIQRALYDKAWRAKVKKCKNPYGLGGACMAIIRVLRKIKFDKKLMQKKITY